MPVKTNECRLYIMDDQDNPLELSEITDITEDLSKTNSETDDPIFNSLKNSDSFTFSCSMSKKDTHRLLKAFGLTWYKRLYYRLRWKINRLICKERRII